VTTEFSELYEQFAGHVLAYARRHASPDDAEDVVAETFHVAWRRRDVVPDEPLPWLIGVAHNVLRAQWRAASCWRHCRITSARPCCWLPGTT
jgi:DNA-directed RNA polymerase specialized sigma24 family protein